MRAPSSPPTGRRGLTAAFALAALGAASAPASAGAATVPPVPFAAAAQSPSPPGTKVYRVPSTAMAPTIGVGTNVLVRLYPDPARARPAVGSIVILHPPKGALGYGSSPRTCVDRRTIERGRPCSRSVGGRSNDRFVERIVAGPGQRVAFRDGRVVRDGVPVDEPYLSDTCADPAIREPACHLPRSIVLPRNRYFLAGDNRGESNDSRYWGPVPRAWMIGEVIEIGVPSPTLFR